jgi:hypothetical protein
MSDGPTQDEIELFDEIGNLAEELWGKSKDIAGTMADPKMISVILFKRLRSHYIGYTALWKNRCYIEGEIIVRSAIETAICIAANSKLGNEFPRMMRRDAAATLKGQIKLHQEEGDLESVESAEAALHFLEAKFEDGEKPAYLQWKSLAEAGDVPLLYSFYKMLSGISSHVTGLSIIRGVGDEETEAAQASLLALSKRNYFNMMAGAGLNGTLIHAGMIDDAASVENALGLIHKLNDLSKSWPEVASAYPV